MYRHGNQTIDRRYVRDLGGRFHMIAHSLLNSNFVDLMERLEAMVDFIAAEPLIFGYVTRQYVDERRIVEVVTGRPYGRRYPLPADPATRAAWTYRLLAYAARNLKDYHLLSYGYGSTNSLLEQASAFNQEVVRPFVDQIEAYLLRTPGGGDCPSGDGPSRKQGAGAGVAEMHRAVRECAGRFLAVLTDDGVGDDDASVRTRRSFGEIARFVVEETEADAPKKELLQLSLARLADRLDDSTIGRESREVGRRLVQRGREWLDELG